jgi:glucosamine kinase
VREHRAAFVAAAPAYARLVLDTDAAASLAGAHRDSPGAVVLAGTGAVGEALRRDGSRVSASGWGFPVGDEGSGAWLGLRAMAEAQRALDGRAPAGALARALWAACGAEREALLGWCERAGQRAYARLAPLVFETAVADPAAAALLARAARSLDAVVRALDPAAELPLVVGGSVGRRLAPRLAAEARARLVEPAGDAADGALLLLVRRAVA